MEKRQSLLLLLTCITLILVGGCALQHWYSLQPCLLCKIERLVYVIAVGVGMAAMLRPSFMDTALKLIVFLFVGGCLVSLYHVAIQQGLLPSPAFCTTSLADATLSTQELRAQLLSTPHVPCHVVTWSLFSVSLAGYNAILSAVLAAVTHRIGRRT